MNKKRGPLPLTCAEYLNCAKSVHGGKFDYSKTVYINSRTKIIIICPEHGEFSQRPDSHLDKARFGCPKCGQGEITLSEFVSLAQEVHKNTYDYNSSVYVSKKHKLAISCKLHGDFLQTPETHLMGRGCPKCNKSDLYGYRATKEIFISAATIRFNNKYDYSEVIFTNVRAKIKVRCPKHGYFYTTPFSHLRAKIGCPICGYNTSRGADVWLDSLNNPRIIREKDLFIEGKRYCVDGYDPETNTVYEFFGTFWHGHPGRFNTTEINPRNKIPYGVLYQNTIDRINRIESHGYIVICKWGR